MPSSNQTPKYTISRLGLTFHRTFFLKRSAIKQVIELFEPEKDVEKLGLSLREIRENSQLGTIYVEAMPRWAEAAGLLTGKKKLTLFGKFVRIYDPGMDQLSTKWLMHYHLSVSHSRTPAFWHTVVSSCFRSGNEFLQSDIIKQITDIYAQEKGGSIEPRYATSTANVFLKTYIESDGLGDLHILEQFDKDRYRVRETEIPPTWAVAAAILDYWQAHFPDQVTVNLSSLTTESGLASLFMISRSRLELILSEMREAGIVELFRVAPPYQVALLNGDPEPVLERMYRHEETA